MESIEDLQAERLLGDIKKVHTAGGQLLADGASGERTPWRASSPEPKG